MTPAFPGPEAFGRGGVVPAGSHPPAELAGAPSIRVDDAVLASPAATAARLHGHWANRSPVVVELGADAAALAAPEVCTTAPYSLSPRFTFERERLNFAVWANNWDLRGPAPVWWRARKAVRIGATSRGPADVVLPDGRPAWCDGGPRGPIDGVVGPDALVVHRESIECGRLTPAPPWRAAAADAGLADDQSAAVLHGAGPARVIAPAGSGKTRVLTERLRHLLDDRGFEHEVVTTVAYNRKAAEELRQRTAALSPHVRTIHSLALWICSMDAEVTVLDEREVRRILDGMVDVRHRANADVLAPFLEALADVRIGLRDPDDVEAERDDVAGFSGVFDRYRRFLADRGAADFDEQVYRAIELLLRDPGIRVRAQRRCRHLLVDEFQDLTPAYLLLLRLVAAPAFSVFGVGDDDQVIYGHVGADPRFLVEFDGYFPGAHHHSLEVNYRCPPRVVVAAGRLLEHNRQRVPKSIRAVPGRSDPADALDVVAVPTSELARAVVARVDRWFTEGTPPGDVAVLARVNTALLPVQAALAGAGVPFRSTLGPEVLGRTGARTLLAYLRIGLRPDAVRSADVVDTIRRPSRRIRREVVEMIRRRRHWSLESLAGTPVPSDRDRDRLDSYVEDLQLVAKACRDRDTPAIVRMIRDDIGLGSVMGVLDGSRSSADRSSHVDDLDALEAAAALCPDPAEFEKWLQDVLGAAGSEGVELSSVHRVKGREWPRVVVFGAHDGLLPHHLARGDLEVEEERRVFHVAITRAIDSLVVVSDSTRSAPFVDEMLGRDVAPIRGHGPRVQAPVLVSPAVADDADLAGADLAVFEALREWRRERARADGLPAYVVCHDRSLRAVAVTRPASLDALGACPGIGPTKLERYGDEILALVEAAGPTPAGAG